MRAERNELPYTPEHEPGGPKVIFLAHVDYVHKRGIRWQQKGSIVTGVLDDMAPASILFSCLSEIKGDAYFSTDEESGMHYAERLARKIHKHYPPPGRIHKFGCDRSWMPTVVVVEVTDIKTNADIAFENFVFFDAGKIRKIMDTPKLKDVKYTFHGASTWDETYRFAEAKIPSFTMSLPVVGDFHTYKAWVDKEKLGKFRRVLLEIDKALG